MLIVRLRLSGTARRDQRHSRMRCIETALFPRSCRQSNRPPNHRRRIRHYVILTLGWIFIFLGILGLFLPILQGILFLCIGGLLLSGESPRMRLLIMKLGRRYPILLVALTAAKGKARAWRDRLRVGRQPPQSGPPTL